VNENIRGEVVLRALSTVKPNGWNPNVMTDEMKASLVHGLQEDGWLASQALLVWGSDENGEPKNLIIDGEHRYHAAQETGMQHGPMVVLDGITEAEAKALTVKMNQKRGDWNMDSLAGLLKDIASSSEDGLSGVSLGFGEEELMKLLAPTETPELDTAAPSGETEKPPAGDEGTPIQAPDAPPETSSVKMVQLFLDDQTQPAFLESCQALAAKWDTKNVTDTVLKAIEFAKGELC
jgi:hypothetical protein